MTIGLSINRCSDSTKPVWREKTRLTSPEVWTAVTSKAWRDSGRAFFSLDLLQVNLSSLLKSERSEFQCMRSRSDRASNKSPRERRSLIDQEDNKRLCLQGVHTGTYGTNHSTNISKISCPFHHRVYYQLTIACSPVGLISTMDRVRLLVDRKSQGSIPGQAWKFSGSFSIAWVVRSTAMITFTFISLSALQNVTHFIQHSPFLIWASFRRSDFFVGSDPKAKRLIGQFNLIFNSIFQLE